MGNSKLIILSLPRSGSSLLAGVVASAGFRSNISPEEDGCFGAHEFNKRGYYEDVPFTLLNDQLIRLYYGSNYSFLYPPSFEDFTRVSESRGDKYPDGFEYDVDKSNVLIPKNFLENIENFTGTTWDVWGITRMIDGGKWERCYSKHNIESRDKILHAKNVFTEKVASCDFNLVLKDPRLAFTMPLYDFKDVKVIWVKRERDAVLRSMRRHYGPRMFTENFIHGTEYVSNHFNHKVKFMKFDEYCERFDKAIEYCISKYSNLEVNFDDLVSLHIIEKLEDFIGAKVDRSIVDSQLVTG